MNFLAQNFCGVDDNFHGVCTGILFFACGFDPLQFPDELLPTILMHDPAGNSVRQATQYVQVTWNCLQKSIQHSLYYYLFKEINSGEFCRYDYYDEYLNFEHYDQATPPLWNVANVNVPLSTYFGRNDWLCNKKDYQRTIDQIPNLYDDFTVHYPLWNHLDFLWAKDIDFFLFPRLLRNINKAERMYQQELAGLNVWCDAIIVSSEMMQIWQI